MQQTARDKIRELHALHADGLLDAAEFERRKQAILDAEYAPSQTAPRQTERPGTEIGLIAGMEIGPESRRYQLERLMAEGGMAQVWAALDLATLAELGRAETVALKILAPQLTRSAALARLLVEEATQARRLAHPNIVRVYDWAQDPATSSYFLIMECLEGEDLASLCQREGRLSWERVHTLLRPVADGLQYAWERYQLVHRDLKPGNVFLTREGEIKLLDFGIAARNRSAGTTGDAGTAGYRAPETLNRNTEPERTQDVYAVAVMIYQMLEGHLPFGASRGATPPAKPSALNPRQWQVLEAALSARPEQRPASVADLLDALARTEGPSPEELAARHAAQLAAEEERQRKEAARRKAETEAARLALRQREQQQREDALRARQEAQQAAAARKEVLRRQLAERRALEAAKAQQEQEARASKAMQAKAAAAYREEQQRARAALAAKSAAELAAQMPRPDSPTADTDGVLRDRFLEVPGHGPDLVLIPTGRFQMGSSSYERGLAMQAGAQSAWVEREAPPHWVGIKQAFALGRYPVTVAEWRAFVRATGWAPSGDADWTRPGFAQEDDHPVTGVSWLDAQAYCHWLSKQTGQTYRLPTEAEWEYACRAGTKTAFHFGDSIDTSRANYDGNYTYNNGPTGEFRHGTTPVASFAPNPWGLYDMHGNVWEWVQDPVHDNYQGAPLDGSAWDSSGDPDRRILRGGCWLYSPRYLRSAVRNGFAAALANDIIGFRVARNLG